MKKIGCLDFNDPVLKRRHFLKVGSLSLLGISMSQFLRVESLLAAAQGAVGGKKGEGTVVHLALAGRGPQPGRHVGPKTEQLL